MVVGNHGGSFPYSPDFWVLKADSIGNFIWGKCIGGTGDDIAYDIKQTPDGGYVIAGTSSSNDGDVTGNNGGNDVWVVKLAPLGLSVPEMQNTIMDLNISQNNDQLNLRFFSNHNEHAQMFLYDISGKQVYEKSFSVMEGINYNQINCAGFAKGMYVVKIDGERNTERGKVFIE